MLVSVGPVTVRVAVPVTVPTIAPKDAEIVLVPAATPVANPPLVIVAVTVLDEVHVASEVRFCVLPLLYVPVAVNCCVPPTAIEAVAGVTAMEVRFVDELEHPATKTSRTATPKAA